jgi:hypothetical protein
LHRLRSSVFARYAYAHYLGPTLFYQFVQIGTAFVASYAGARFNLIERKRVRVFRFLEAVKFRRPPVYNWSVIASAARTFLTNGRHV